MLKRLFFLTSGLLLAFALAGCARGGATPTSAPPAPAVTSAPTRQQPAAATPETRAAAQPTATKAPRSSIVEPTPTIEIFVRSGRLTDSVAVRLEPDQAATVLGELPEDASIIATGTSGEWYEIVYGGGPGGHGWVPQAAVSFELATPTPVPSPTLAAVAAAATEPPPAAPQPPAGQPAAAVSRPSAPKLGGKLVFQNQNGGVIYIANADGTGLRQLTTGFEPALSPDGTQVAFSRWDEPRGLYAINVDGSNERFVYGANRVRSPTWTPDGQSLIFERSTGSYQCAPTPFGCLTQDEWRANFFGQDCIETSFGKFCFDDYGLLTVDLTGLTRYDLATGATRDLPTSNRAQSPNHSPVDSSVLFVDENGLEVTSNDSNDPPRRLVNAPGLLAAATYSPDGQFFYGSRKSHDHWNIWRWRADGSQATALTAPPALRDRPINSVAPAVSPDGRYVAFLTDRTGKWELWIMDADGSNQRPLAPDAFGGVDFSYNFVTERMIDWGS